MHFAQAGRTLSLGASFFMKGQISSERQTTTLRPLQFQSCSSFNSSHDSPINALQCRYKSWYLGPGPGHVYTGTGYHLQFSHSPSAYQPFNWRQGPKSGKEMSRAGLSQGRKETAWTNSNPNQTTTSWSWQQYSVVGVFGGQQWQLTLICIDLIRRKFLIMARPDTSLQYSISNWVCNLAKKSTPDILKVALSEDEVDLTPEFFCSYHHSPTVALVWHMLPGYRVSRCLDGLGSLGWTI